ncbi:MAG: histidinol-phosphatase [Rhodobacteraceae bacterium]|nr:histidinol-phosphatase [Paracoccaceae bacterium]
MRIDDELQADLIATAAVLADAARPVTLQYFRSRNLIADNKLEQDFDPVTIADREAEQAMRSVLGALRPDDGIYGEEFGQSPGTSGLTWVLDPIDGTRSFISGAPTWGVLVAVNAGDAPLYGIIDQPFIGERFSGGFGQAEVTGPYGRLDLATRPCNDLADAVLFSTFPEIGTRAEYQAFGALSSHCRLTRYGMDCYAYAMIAAGQIDLVVEAGLSAYDVQAPIAVIEAAGGIVTNWQGGPAHAGGQILAAGNRDIHKAAMAFLNAD